MEKSWVDKMIEREAIPKPLRQDTIEQFCQENNTSVANYHYHKYKKENQAKILDITLSKAHSECPQILKVLIEKAKDGDMKAMDMYINSILKLAKNLDIKSDNKPIGLLNFIDNALRDNISNSEDTEAQEQN